MASEAEEEAPVSAMPVSLAACVGCGKSRLLGACADSGLMPCATGLLSTFCGVRVGESPWTLYSCWYIWAATAAGCVIGESNVLRP